MIPIYIEAYLKTMPGLIPHLKQVNGQTETQFRQEWARIAQEVARRARFKRSKVQK